MAAKFSQARAHFDKLQITVRALYILNRRLFLFIRKLYFYLHQFCYVYSDKYMHKNARDHAKFSIYLSDSK